ncbi:MAG: S8 family serine peptidase [Bacteroidota bacterium]
MKNKLLYTLAAVFLGTSLFAQLAPAPPASNTGTLELKLAEKYTLRSIELDKALEKQKRARIVHGANGEIIQAMSVTATGHIIYTTTYNIGAGKTLSTNKVWPGGAMGVALTGAGMTNRLGIWDGGKVLNTHQEFNNRVTQPDGAAALSDHATHVAATMIASGVSANAKGMSYMAPLKAYDWNNDASEMASAAQAGMLISNHSYGSISGWRYNDDSKVWEWWGDPDVSTTIDYKFGQYDDRSAEWDQIAADYPYYLICKAAGNDRGDLKSASVSDWYYSDGTPGSGTAPGKDGGTSGYDCIPQYGTAKNILTVGAVNKIGGNTGNGWTKVSDVVMSDFSGWGPTDDGRIKPDVVSPGVGLYSAISTGTTNYDTYNGTSMATPAASGSLLLVQQHYNNAKGKYMRSASLKGLAIHTADEAGTTGPDYTFGWGLLNTASCVKFINDSTINKMEERVLGNSQPQTLQFNVDAGKPLRITICWTDKAGTPVSTNLLNNTTKMLVNDLDIRLTKVSNQQKFNPYILNPAAPATAATTGDNTRDNVEMIHIDAPDAGIYSLTISHKGTLLSAAAQPFSLLISNGVEKASAGFYANKTVICPSQTIQYTDASSGGILSRKWYFPGGNPSTSTLASPIVTYTTAGNYAVALKVTSALGDDSVYAKNYATVGGLALPFTETFEEVSPTAKSWGVINPDADITWAYYNTSGTTPGERSAGINYFNYAQEGERDGLISPPLSFKGFTNVSLSFKHAYTKYDLNSKSDSLIVYASTNCGTSWIKVAIFSENGSGSFATYGESSGYSSTTAFLPASAEDWCGGSAGASCKTVPLGAFSGNASVLLKFEGYCNFSNNLYLDNITVTGTPLKPIAAISTTQTTVCANTPVNFSDLSQNHPATWTWSFAGASPSASTAQNPTITYPNPGTYGVKLRVANITGADSIELLNYITVIAPPPTPNIKAAGSVQFCVGDSIALSTDSTGPVKWYFNDGLIAQNTQQVYASKTGVYRIARSSGTCESSSSLNITSSVKDARPTISATVTGTAFCEGSSSMLTSSASSGNQWYRNNVAIADAVKVVYLALDSGSYTVVSNMGGCPSDPSLPKTYAIFPKPVVGPVSGPENPKRDETVSYSVPNEAGYTYQWSIVNGSIITGNNTATITAKFNNADSAIVGVVSRSTASNCSSLASIKRVLVVPAVGLNEYTLINALSVYPIPAKAFLTVQTESIKAHQSTLKITNILGQVCLQQDLQLISGTQKHTLDVSTLKKGIYFVELQSGNQKTIKKFIVE